jgi:hypothetical protein
MNNRPVCRGDNRFNSLHRTPWVSRDKTFGGQRWQQPRQCPGRDDQWAVEGRVSHRRALLKTTKSLQMATLERVAWFNHHRMLSSIGNIPPAQAEVNYDRQLAGKNETEVSIQTNWLPRTPGLFTLRFA